MALLAATRDVRERAKRTVWSIISEACNAACRTPSRTQHTGQRARGLRDWYWAGALSANGVAAARRDESLARKARSAHTP
eukprot:COSAG06_NODE_804_length_12172_cov_15.171954_3_plen_80_part_00